MTVAAATLRSATSATACTRVSVVLESSLAPLGSVVPFEATVAVFARWEPSGAEEARVTSTVKESESPEARPVELEQLRDCPVAEHRRSDPAAWKVVPAGRASGMVNPPVLSEGPLLVTVRG